MPPPSSGGVHIVQILNILEGYPIGFLGAGGAETIHLMAEAMKLAYADRSEYLGDPDFVDVPVAALTSKAYAEHLRGLISRNRARPADEHQARRPRAVRELRDHPLLDRRWRRQRRRQHLHHQLQLRHRAGRRGHRHPPQQRARRLLGQARRAQRLRPDRRRRQCGRAGQAAAVVDVADHRAARTASRSWSPAAPAARGSSPRPCRSS